jgi:hypothetical protein
VRAIVLLAALIVGCEAPGGVIVSVVDAAPDAAACPPQNPGPVPCEDALSCPVVPVGSCGHWECPKNDAGQSFCEWAVKD